MAVTRTFNFANDDSQEKKATDSEMRWYVVHTYSTYENKVKDALEKKMQNSELGKTLVKVVVPSVEDHDVKTGQTTVRKAFPGYIVVKMKYTKETWYAIRNAPGVTGFVGPDPMNPTPLTPKEVRALNLDDDEITDEIFIDAFKIGDRISVTSGPLAGYLGTVEAVLPEKKCIKATVSMFGRNISAELEYIQVEKADE
ncbi:MAG: transcription termination/antitermination factor NusG [Clostridia bacterium]|nr:transcription termination/antitermination factor NusG [Clostridia bacterium]